MNSLPLYPEPPRYAIEDVPVRDLDSSCRACKLGTDSVRTVCMSAAALDQSKGGESMGTLLVVTASPTQKDDRLGRPLTGDGGTYLRKKLEAWKGTVIYDHALRCPIGTKKPTPKYYEACRGYLASTYREAEPNRVILVGTEAVNAFMGRGLPTMSVHRGYGHLSDGTPVFIVVPPGPAMRNRFVRGWLDDDLHWAMTINPERAPLDALYFMVDTPEMAREAEVEAHMSGGFTSDLETFGSPHNEEQTILTVGVTPFDEPICYVWEKEALEDPEIREPYLRMLIDPSLPKGGQNWKFDCVHIQSAWGVVVRGTTFCTKLMTRIQRADADAKLSNLQAQVGMIGGKDEAAAFVDAGVKELRKMIRKPETEPTAMAGIEPWKLDLALDRIREGDEPKVYAYAAIPGNSVRPRYCGTDCISTDRIRARQESQMEDWQRRVWDETGRALNDAVVQMECNGIAVSRAAVGRLREFCDVEITEHSTVLSQYAPADFNSNSTAQVGKLLFETLGLPNKGRTKTGYKTGAEILEKLEHPAAQAILGLRKAGKFKSQYADGMAFFIRDDGRIHPSINQDGTETSRMSCSNPNLFNIPRPTDERGKLARDVYVVPKGRRFIEADYSQIELRVAAMLSGDQVMIDMFKRDVDFHLETAKLIAPIFGLNPDDITKEHPLRDRAKTVVFATLFGDTVAGLAAKLNIHKNLAAKLQSSILGQFLALKKRIDEWLRFGRQNGYATTWWDGADYHRRPLWRIADADDAARETAERSSWNSVIQGSAATFTNASLGRFQQVIDQERLPCKQVLTVYDSILLDCDEAAVDDCAGRLAEVMTSWNSTGPGGSVPLKVDVKVGASWGSMERLEVV